MTRSFTPTKFGIDVLLPASRKSPYLVQAVQSIMDQDFTDWIIFLLVDKGDLNSELIKRMVPSSKLRVVEFVENFNLSNRLNYAMSLGNSQYIARMDADDICHSQRFSSQIRMLQINDCSLVGSSAKVVDANGKLIGEINVSIASQQIKRKLALKNQFIHPSLIFKRDLVREIQFDPSLIRSQDYGFILEVAKRFEISNSPEFLLSYRVHNSNHSNTRLSFKEMRILGQLKVEFAKIQNRAVFYSLSCHLIWVLKNLFLSPAKSLSLRIYLSGIIKSNIGQKSNIDK